MAAARFVQESTMPACCHPDQRLQHPTNVDHSAVDAAFRITELAPDRALAAAIFGDRRNDSDVQPVPCVSRPWRNAVARVKDCATEYVFQSADDAEFAACELALVKPVAPAIFGPEC